MSKIISLAIVVFVSFSAHAENQWQYEVSTQVIFDRIVADSKKHSQTNDGLIYALYLLNNSAADKKLVELSRYYLGSATGHELGAAITNRGKKILPLIDEELEKPTTCAAQNCSSSGDIVRRLMEWKSIINNGDAIEFVQ